MRTALALLLALSLVFGMAAIQADPSAAASATAEPGAPSGTSPAPADTARAGSFRLGTGRILDSDAHRGLVGGELLLDRTSYAASKAACDPNHVGLEGAPEALRVVLLPTWCWSPLQRQSTAGR